MSDKLVEIPQWLKESNGMEVVFRAPQHEGIPQRCKGWLAIEIHDGLLGSVKIMRITNIRDSELGSQGDMDQMDLDQDLIDCLSVDADGRISLGLQDSHSHEE